MTYRYEIAGLKLEIEGSWNESAQKNAAAYESDFSGKADIKLKIESDMENIKIPEGSLIVKGRQRHWLSLSGGGIAFYDYVPEISNEVINLITFNKSFTEIKMKLCKSSVLGLTVDMRPFNLFDRVMRLIALKHNRIVLHASAISYNDNAILFSAPSGTGKSTHTSLWQEYYPETILFNDDAPIISLDGSEIIAHGSPWCGTSGLNANRAAKVKAIVFLEQAENCSIKKIQGTEAIFRMFKEISKPVYPDLMQNMLDKMSRILTDIPTYVLYCDISREAVEIVKNELKI